MPERPAWVAGYLPELQSLGISATEALSRFRAPVEQGGLGLHVSTSEFYRQWGQTLAAVAAREGFLAVNLGLRPNAEQVTPLTSRFATGFQFHFDVLVRDNQTGETYYRPSGYRTQRLVSFRKAKAGAIDAIAAAAADYTGPGTDLTILGARPTGVTQYVPGGAL